MRRHDLTTKRQWQRQIRRQRQLHLENTFNERSYRLLTFDIYDQSDEETWPDRQKDNYSDNDKDKYMDHDRDMTWRVTLREINLHFSQLRTWIYDNHHCDLTIRSDTGQHSQFLLCLNAMGFPLISTFQTNILYWLLKLDNVQLCETQI